LQVEERINGTRLVGIYCDTGLEVDYWSYKDEVEIKFDDRTTSDRMRIAATRLAIQLEFKDLGRHWMSFSLDGAGTALASIGAIAPQKALNPPISPATQKSKIVKTSRPESAAAASSVATPPWSQYKTWLRLSKGMTAEDVKAILGEPERTMTIGPNQVWYYGAGKYRVYFTEGRFDRWTD
jgi:SmpA / OmlA family